MVVLCKRHSFYPYIMDEETKTQKTEIRYLVSQQLANVIPRT